MLTAERILCWLLGIGLLVLAFRLVREDKSGLTLTFGVFLFCCGLGWVQGLANTWLVSNINSKLAALGTQMDNIQTKMGNIQTATTKMQDELSQHQNAIDKHQKELDEQQGKIRGAQSDIGVQRRNSTDQFGQLATMQATLAGTQTNINNQQRQIEDVQFLVTNLFSHMTQEAFQGSDSNRVQILHLGQADTQVFFKLQGVPLQSSIQITAQANAGMVGQFPLVGVYSVYNIAWCFFTGGGDPATLLFTVQYIKDTRQTHHIQQVAFSGTKVLLDGAYVPFNQENPRY